MINNWNFELEDGNGYGVAGVDMNDETWHNDTSFEGRYSGENGHVSVSTYSDFEDELVFSIDTGSSEAEGIMSSYIDQVEDELKQYSEFTGAFETKRDSFDDIDVSVSLEGSEEAVSDRLETAYMAIEQAIGYEK